MSKIFLNTRNLVYPSPANAFTASQVISQMGASPEIMMGNPSQQYYKTAYMTMAKIPHGSALPNGYVNNFLLNPAIASVWWNAGGPWVQAVSGNSNTCTNARIMFAGVETYIKRISTGAWEKLVENDGNLQFGLDKYLVSSYAWQGAATKKIVGKIGTLTPNLPSYNDWITGSPGTYYTLHNAIHPRVAFPGGGADLSGLFATCLVRLISEDGDLNFVGDCKKYASIGFDYWPTMTSSFSSDMKFKPEYTGGEYNPGSGGSAFTLIPTDGSWLRLFYIPYLQGGGFLDTSSSYAQTNGAASMGMTNAEITANPPILLPNSSI